MPPVPPEIATGFVVLPLTVLAILSTLLIKSSPRLLWVVGILVGWAILTAALAHYGILADFTSGRPWLPGLLLLELAFVVWLAFFSQSSLYLAQIPQSYLIGLQCFRIPVELLMAELAARKLLAVEMTYYGRNFDILIGATAVLLAAWVANREESAWRNVIIGWNMMGLGLVSSVLVHGMLSVPYPFQILHLSVPTFIVASFPVVWLLTLLVPIAYLLHFVSLRRTMAGKTELPAETTP